MVTTPTQVRALLSDVVDPEVPVLTIADLGILRNVEVTEAGEVVVTITPTYSGCPAMAHIEGEIERVLAKGGMSNVRVVTTFQPSWTTDWMSAAGRRKLEQFGIAPPRTDASSGISCPRCSSDNNRTVSEFGSTACKSLRVCSSCREPFDHFKEI